MAFHIMSQQTHCALHVCLQDQREFAKLAESFKSTYNDGARVQWGGHILGPKSQVCVQVG